jgi:hypothetical protein
MANSTFGLSAGPQAPARELPVGHNPFVSAHSAFTNTDDLVSRILHLEERLIGPSPTDSAKSVGGTNPVSSGTFNELRLHANTIHARLTEAFEAISRIENQLP